MPADWRFLVVPSGIEADKAGGARDRYNRASVATQVLYRLWTAAVGPAPSLAAALASGPGAVDTLQALIAGHRDPAFTAEELAARLSHFRAEDARVPPARDAFAAGDVSRLGELAAASQADAERWLGNQIPETSALVRVLRETGGFAASSFGAGFGGSVWALAPAGEAVAIAEAAVTRYRASRPHIGSVDWFSARPGPALVAL